MWPFLDSKKYLEDVSSRYSHPTAQTYAKKERQLRQSAADTCERALTDPSPSYNQAQCNQDSVYKDNRLSKPRPLKLHRKAYTLVVGQDVRHSYSDHNKASPPGRLADKRALATYHNNCTSPTSTRAALAHGCATPKRTRRPHNATDCPFFIPSGSTGQSKRIGWSPMPGTAPHGAD